MRRRPRRLVAGGIHHVRDHVSCTHYVFRSDDEADRLEVALAETKKRDGCLVLARCVMPNHYHLAVRTGAVPLSRSMRRLGGGFTQQHNWVVLMKSLLG